MKTIRKLARASFDAVGLCDVSYWPAHAPHQTCGAPHRVLYAQQVDVLAFEPILWRREAKDALRFLAMTMPSLRPLWWCCDTNRVCVSAPSSTIATPSY